ncbi:hypothetical protein [Halobacteriovorax sp. HLS]|uniref:hypothetical protein n=1 Tax=Halobacteriovorax sp. HLS TaxID=2234000 RepID=UPI000FD70CB1|nr:hypothetical protein [Halobacteriovorax sp. HLS]
MKKMIFLLLMSSISANADTNFINHVLSGYEVGQKFISIENGKTTKDGAFVCDYKSVEEKSLLSIIDGVYTFHVKETSNRYCAHEVREYIEISTHDIYTKDLVKFFETMESEGIDVSFDNSTKFFTMKNDQETFEVDFTKGTTLEAANALMTVSGESSNGEFVTTHGNIEFSKLENTELPLIRDDIQVCDDRRDSDPNDSTTYFDEICH